ncbi:MAG: glucose-6-phosphate dehydrogenase (NADP(+)) [Spirochaetales bacterium]|nr:glucose-6-phosphate dehydrogenase (NADP(+)) [Spirochaetales bacterium]
MKQIFIQFGGTGDLAQKKLLPAYRELMHKGYDFHVISLGRKFSDREEYLEHMLGEGAAADPLFKSRIDYLHFSMGEESSKQQLIDKLHEYIGSICDIELIYYIALQPSLYESAIYSIKEIHENLQGCRLRKKIVVEKPFGFDKKSAKTYNDILTTVFSDREIYRIDHYLGKEFMQNLLVMRFYNDVMQGLWNKQYIDYIQVIFDEVHGVEQRLGFYEKIGVVRDTVQNHILQIITYLTMGEPVEFTPEEIAHEKVKVLKSIRPIRDFSLGQYASLGEKAKGDIHTPTYAAFKLYVDTFDFSDIPIYVRTGKMQEKAASQIYIAFKHFRGTALSQKQTSPNAIIITIHPEMNIDIQMNMKDPSAAWAVKPVRFNFNHFQTFKVNTPEAYQQIIEKIIRSDKTLFPTIEEIEAAWGIVAPMLEPEEGVEIYEDRSLPSCARELVKQDGIEWVVS